MASSLVTPRRARPGHEQPEPDGHGHQDQERPQPCHGCFAR